jgi:hypothetical protein
MGKSSKPSWNLLPPASWVADLVRHGDRTQLLTLLGQRGGAVGTAVSNFEQL